MRRTYWETMLSLWSSLDHWQSTRFSCATLINAPSHPQPQRLTCAPPVSPPVSPVWHGVGSHPRGAPGVPIARCQACSVLLQAISCWEQEEDGGRYTQ